MSRFRGCVVLESTEMLRERSVEAFTPWNVAKNRRPYINSGRRKTSEDGVRLVVVGEEGEHPVHQRVQLDEALT